VTAKESKFERASFGRFRVIRVQNVAITRQKFAKNRPLKLSIPKLTGRSIDCDARNTWLKFGRDISHRPVDLTI
jgi:hypothetical protein